MTPMSESWRIRCLYAAFAVSLVIGTALLAGFPGPSVFPLWQSATGAPSENTTANDENVMAVLPTIETVAELDRLLSHDHSAIYIDADWSAHAKVGLQVIQRAIQLGRQWPAKQRVAATFFCVDITRGYDAPLYTALLKRGVDRNFFSSGAGPLLVFRHGELIDAIDCVGCLTADEFIARYRRAFER